MHDKVSGVDGFDVFQIDAFCFADRTWEFSPFLYFRASFVALFAHHHVTTLHVYPGRLCGIAHLAGLFPAVLLHFCLAHLLSPEVHELVAGVATFFAV